jgi:ferredoxin-NADP reductase
MAQFQTFHARLSRSIPLTEFTKHIEFELVNGNHLNFVPGQWLSIKASTPDGEEITRAYSIASPPPVSASLNAGSPAATASGHQRSSSANSLVSLNAHLALCLNRVQDGFMSNHLCSLEVGSEIDFQGPFGNFILRPPLRDTLFIATGTGIAPFRSMLHWLLERGGQSQAALSSRPSSPASSASASSQQPLADPPHNSHTADEPTEQPLAISHRFWLLFGARTLADLYYRNEFEMLASRHSNFQFLPTLSRAASDWSGLRGYVQEHVPAIVGDRLDMHAYICGLDKMVRANRELLKGRGWDRTSIRYERYD